MTMMKTQMLMLLTGLCLPLYAAAICPSAGPNDLWIYDGTIAGKYPIRMTLQFKDDDVSGVYFYTSQLKDISLQGHGGAAREIALDELDFKKVEVAKFVAAFPAHDTKWGNGKTDLECEVISGSWQKNGADQKLPVHLTLAGITHGTLARPYGEDIDAELVHKRALQFQNAVKTNDKNVVAASMAYPVGVTLAKRTTIANAREFLRHYDAIFTPAYKAKVAAGIPRNMFERNGNLMLGSGEVWFQNDGKVIALNN